MSEREYTGEFGEIFAFPFGIVQEEIAVWTKLSPRILEYLSGLLAERNALKREHAALKRENTGLLGIVRTYHPEYLGGCDCPQCSDATLLTAEEQDNG